MANENTPVENQDSNESKGFFGKYGATIFIVCLTGYVILLAIGVIAEIFKIQSILDWWIWRSPGK